MEEKFVLAWEQARRSAEDLGVRTRPVDRAKALETARRTLSGNRSSDGFLQLQKLNRLDLSLEALAVSKKYTALFTDEQVNNALILLLNANYRFK